MIRLAADLLAAVDDPLAVAGNDGHLPDRAEALRRLARRYRAEALRNRADRRALRDAAAEADLLANELDCGSHPNRNHRSPW